MIHLSSGLFKYKIFGLNSSDPISTNIIKNKFLDRLGEDISISSTSVQPDIGICMRQDAIIGQFHADLLHTCTMILFWISYEQLLFNPTRPYGFSWKVKLAPKLILSVTM